MRFLELFLLRILLWFGLPLLLLTLAIGPKRLLHGLKSSWSWLFRRRLDPEEILSQVVEQHEQLVESLRKVVARAEATEVQILGHLEQSEKNAAAFEQDAAQLSRQGDELGARAALYKLNLEKSAIEGFRKQQQRQREIIPVTRQRLYLLELRLRQYEVGRSVLLSQLAEAENAEQQYAIAQQFDPFNAVANWQRAEGIVQEKTINARAIERVYLDTTEITADVDPILDTANLEAQLAQLRASAPARPAESHPPLKGSLPVATEAANNEIANEGTKRPQKH